TVTFFIEDKNEPHKLGIALIDMRKNVFSYSSIIGHDTSDIGDIEIPSNEFDGFLKFNAADCQHHIHELFPTATMVTLATNMKEFRMITKGSGGNGPLSPRQMLFRPADGGVTFMRKNPFMQAGN